MLGLILAQEFLAPSLALADEDARFNLSGFATLGATRTTSNEVEFVRDLSQPRGAKRTWTPSVDSVAGVQASWQLTPLFDATVQAVSRYRYDRSYAPEIAWAFVKFEPDPALTVRAGRFGTDFFMLSDSRLVGYSYLTVRPPGDFFWHLPFSSIDGVDLVLAQSVGEGVLRGKAFYGRTQTTLPLADQHWNIDDSVMSGAYLDYQLGAWQLRGGYAGIRFSQNLPLAKILPQMPPAMLRQLLAELSVAGAHSDYFSLGAVYDRGPWQIHLMLNKIKQGSQAFEDSDAAYFMLGHRFGKLTPYFGYSRVLSSARPKPHDNPVLARVMADAHVNQATTMLGLRWDVATHTAIKLQWDNIRGQTTSIFPYRLEPQQGEWSGRMNVFSLTLDFIFK